MYPQYQWGEPQNICLVRSVRLLLTDYMVTGFCPWMLHLVCLHGYSVLDILREKHPGVIDRDESAFMPCSVLPPLVDLDITADYVECAAHQIQGSAGPGGSIL